MSGENEFLYSSIVEDIVSAYSVDRCVLERSLIRNTNFKDPKSSREKQLFSFHRPNLHLSFLKCQLCDRHGNYRSTDIQDRVWHS